MIVKGGKQFQMVFHRQVEQLFPSLQQIQRLQGNSMLSTTMEYFALSTQAIHGKCLMVSHGLRTTFHNILGRLQSEKMDKG